MKVKNSTANYIYTAAIHLYQGGLQLASIRNRKARLMLDGRKKTLQTLKKNVAPSDNVIWIHAASLGEFEQGRPLIELIRRNLPDRKIVLSFYSPSGFEVRKNWDGADAVVYLPADTPRAMRRFIDALNPSLAIFVKYEFWGNCLNELRRRNIPVFLISAVFRPQQIFFAPHGAFFRRMLTCFSHIFVQDRSSLTLLKNAGIEQASIAGDTRFDRVTDIMRSTSPIPILESFKQKSSKTIFIAGSSWPADEAVYFPWLKANSDAVASIIAPHEFNPSRLKQMKEMLAPDINAVLLSEANEDPSLTNKADCLIIDCFGLLSSAYRYADIAYIGGGFGSGIHNINEAAVYGMPVIFGPHHDKFIEAREIISAGGGFDIENTNSFDTLMTTKIMTPSFRENAGKAAASYIKSKIGATQIIYEAIFSKRK